MGVPINSLQDLLLLRQIREEADPFRSGLKALAEGIQQGIEEKKKLRLEENKRAEQWKRSLSLEKSLGNKHKVTRTLQDGKLKTVYEPIEDYVNEPLMKLQKKAAELGAEDEIGSVEQAHKVIARESREEELRQERKIKLSQERVDLDREKEERLEIKDRLRTVADFGGTFDTQDPVTKEILSGRNIDTDVMMEFGGARRNSDGTITILPKREMDRIISERTVPQTVQTAIVEFKDSKDILEDALAEFKDMKLDKISIKDKSLIEQLMSEVGPLSLQAKSDLLRQFTNPRLAALFDKLERAFQKYRVKTTGVQASDKELSRLRPLIANLVQNPETFKMNMADLLKELDQSVSNRINGLRAAGRDEKVISGFEGLYFDKESLQSEEESEEDFDSKYEQYLKIIGG